MKYIIRLLNILLIDVLCMIMPIIAYTQTNAIAKVVLFILASAFIGIRASYELWLYKKRNENKMKAWIARDENGTLWAFASKPRKDNGAWTGTSAFYYQTREWALPEGVNPQWEDDEPIEIELKLEKI